MVVEDRREEDREEDRGDEWNGVERGEESELCKMS